MAKPKLVVFDLDFTLWPFWLDTHVDPPFKKRSDGKVYDRHNQVVKFYPDVPQILKRLHSEGYTLAVASRSPCTPEAIELCQLFHWDQYFTYTEVYPGSKVAHFARFHQLSGIPYKDMIFFDDEHRNIVEVGRLGVTCVSVDSGTTEELVNKGFEMFRRNVQSSS